MQISTVVSFAPGSKPGIAASFAAWSRALGALAGVDFRYSVRECSSVLWFGAFGLVEETRSSTSALLTMQSTTFNTCI